MTTIVASKADSMFVSNSSGTSITASGVSGSSAVRHATIRSPTSGCRVDSSQRKLLGALEDDRGDAGAVDRAIGDHVLAPALGEQVAHALGCEQLVDDGVGREGLRRRAAQAPRGPRTCPRRSRR